MMFPMAWLSCGSPPVSGRPCSCSYLPLRNSLPGSPMFPLLLLNCFSSIFPHALYPSYFHIYPKLILYNTMYSIAVLFCSLWCQALSGQARHCILILLLPENIWAVSGCWGQKKHFLHNLAPIDKTAAVITEWPEEDVNRNGGVLHTYDTHVWEWIVKPFMCNMLFKILHASLFLAKSGQ